jgi:hypothetical protein
MLYLSYLHNIVEFFMCLYERPSELGRTVTLLTCIRGSARFESQPGRSLLTGSDLFASVPSSKFRDNTLNFSAVVSFYILSNSILTVVQTFDAV